MKPLIAAVLTFFVLAGAIACGPVRRASPPCFRLTLRNHAGWAKKCDAVGYGDPHWPFGQPQPIAMTAHMVPACGALSFYWAASPSQIYVATPLRDFVIVPRQREVVVDLP